MFYFSFAKRKLVINKAKFWGIFSIIVIIWILDITFVIQKYKNGDYSRSYPVYVVLLSLPLFWLLWKGLSWVKKKLDFKLDNYQHEWEIAELGNKGEEIIIQELKRTLNKKYSFFKNIILPGHTSDLDIIIVGPKGIFLCEVKNYKKTKVIFDTHNYYYKQHGGNIVKEDTDIRAIVKWRAEKLEEYLTERGIGKIDIKKVIVYVNSNSVELKEFGNSYHVYIARGIEGFNKYLSTSIEDKRFDENYCHKINEILKGLSNFSSQNKFRKTPVGP